MDSSSYLDLVSSGGRMIGEAAAGNLDQPIPGCGEWVMADLVAHQGFIYNWAASIVAAGGDPPGPTAAYTRNQDGLLSWFADAHALVVSELEAHAPEDPAWVFVSRAAQNVGWWYRRQAHETAVHLFDATAWGSQPATMAADMAADGVDEYLTVFLPRVLARNPVDDLRGTLHLHATDTPGEWWLDLVDPSSPPRREHAKADTALRGPAAGLNLWLWNRQSPEEAGLEVFGDPAVVKAFSQVKA